MLGLRQSMDRLLKAWIHGLRRAIHGLSPIHGLRMTYIYPGQLGPTFCVKENAITHKENNRFALVLARSYTIMCPTTMEKEVSMRYSVFFPSRNKRFVTNRGNLERHGLIRTTTYTTYLRNSILRTFYKKKITGRKMTIV